MPDLGKAYVQIIPSAEGIAGQITKVISGEGEAAGAAGGTAMMGSMLKAVVASGATAAVAKAVYSGIKASVTEYADYEQLTGGVETLFKDSAGIVQEYARNAYKTAGLSANDYMETVTSFSASLLQSLGGDTEKAAKKADQAIRDMSDNANKMGSDMQSIQNAYQSFARGQYQLLDNLKLGYGGTKEEMQRLLEDAEAISGIHYDISSYGDIVDAIHVIQTEMGITGTTAEEAEETISGSVNAAKGAWHNWVMDLSNDNADMARSTEDMATAMAIAIANIVPKVGNTVVNIVDAIASIPDAVAIAGSKIRYDEFLDENPIKTFDDLKAAIDDATASVEDWKTKYDTAVAYGSNPAFQAKQWAEAQQLLDEIVKDTDNLDIIFQAAADGLIEVGAAADMAHLPLNTFLGGLKSYKQRTQEAENPTEDLADALSEEEQAAKEAHAAIIDIASAAIDARYSGDDLRESYKDLSGQLDKLRESGDDAAIALAEQQLHLLNLAATNQELSESFALMGIQATGDLTKLSQYLIDADVSADEFASGVASMRDGVVNSFQTIRDENALTASEMTAVLQDNLEVTREWGTNLGNLWRSTSDSTVRAYIYQLAQWGPQYASAVAEFANGGYAELEAQAYAYAEAGELSADQYSWGIWMRQWVAENAAGDLADSALSGLDESGDAKGKGQTFGDSFTSGVSSVDGTASGSALAASSVSGLKQQQAAMKASAQLLARGAVDMIKTVAPMFNAAGVNFGAQLQRGLYSGGSAVRNAAYSVSKEAYNSAYSYAGNFWYIGKAMDSGMASGLWSGSSAVTSAAYSVAKAAYRAAASYLGIHSPSRLFRDKIGAMIPEGMAQGITQNATLVTRAMQGLAQSTVGSYKVNGAGMNARGIGAQLAPGVYGGYNITTNVTVNGAENPEDYANRLARQLQLQMRMA